MGQTPVRRETSPAAAYKPVLAVSFAGYDLLRGQVEAIGKLADAPRLADAYEAMLVLLTQGRGLAGLDMARPWGLVALSDGQEHAPEQFNWLGFLPTKNLSQLAALVRDPATGRPLAPGADGVFAVESPGGKQFLPCRKAHGPMSPPRAKPWRKPPPIPCRCWAVWKNSTCCPSASR